MSPIKEYEFGPSDEPTLDLTQPEQPQQPEQPENHAHPYLQALIARVCQLSEIKRDLEQRLEAAQKQSEQHERNALSFRDRLYAVEARAEVLEKRNTELNSLPRVIGEYQEKLQKSEILVNGLTAKLDLHKQWYPFELGQRVFVCAGDGEGDIPWSAVFLDEEDAQKWCMMMQDDDDDGRDHQPLPGEIAGMRFWNSYEPPPAVEGPDAQKGT